ncbi:MAG: response regulator transcription factor [Rhodospirillales bacterium]|nr:response regulator transcription factor [Rhodospirillales bacterium]
MSTQTGWVLVVDDDPGMREALESLFKSVGLSVITCGCAAELHALRLPEGPRCLVLDVRLPGKSGLDMQEELLRRKDGTPIIFITGHGDIPMSVRAMKAGAVEFLPKPFRDQDLLDAVQLALQRDRARLEREQATQALRRLFDTLTPREKEVMAHVVEGKLNKQIAAAVGVSEITVKVHRGNVMRKMKAASLADLVRIAERLRDL